MLPQHVPDVDGVRIVIGSVAISPMFGMQNDFERLVALCFKCFDNLWGFIVRMLEFFKLDDSGIECNNCGGN